MHRRLRSWGTPILLASVLSLNLGFGGQDLRALARQVNAAFRALDNMSIKDNLPEIEAKLKDADGLVEKVRALDPNYSEIRIWDSKSRGWRRQIGMVRPAATGGGSPAAVAPVPPSGAKGAPTVTGPGKEEVKADWQAFVDYHREFRGKFDAIFNANGQVMFDPGTMDAAMVKLEHLRLTDVPEARRRLDLFGVRYGRDTDSIDRRLFELTPENTRKSRLDPENQRPDGSAGHSFSELQRMLKLIAEGPVAQAAGILTTVRSEAANTSQKSDALYTRLEAQLGAALRLDPANAEVHAELTAIQKQRSGLQAAAGDRLRTAKFPPGVGRFAGPGDPKDLAAAAIRYFNEVYPKEKAIAASVAGDWVSARKNLVGQTIQWGLPVFIASIQNSSKEVCRVFKMTVLASEGNSPPKAPPFRDHWTGDSYQMLIVNVPR
jgi:hypothetical protein